MGIALVITILAIEILLATATLAGWFDRQRIIPIVRIAVFVGFALLVLTGVIEWAPRYYALGVWLLVLAAWGVRNRYRRDEPARNRRVILTGLGVSVLTLLTASPALIFPEYTPLEPTGDFEVKTVSHTFTDPSRIDPHSKHGDHRWLTVGFWYPDTAEGDFPLVAFSHGGLGIRDSNPSMFEELASHGYVVASIDHTGHALFSNDTTGRRTWIDGGYLGEIRRENARSDPEQSLDYYRKWMAVRVADIDFVITRILTESTSPTAGPLFGLVDPGRIGLVGHSLGGAAVLGVGRLRTDVEAVIALESPYMADIEDVVDGRFVWNADPYPIPTLNVYSDSAWKKMEDWPQYARNVELLGDPSTFNTHISGVGHLHLTDLSLTSPFLTRILNGHPSTGNSREALQALNRLALDFFDTYLKDGQAFSPG